MAGESTSSDVEGGPMWGRFFDSIGHDDAESLLSGSHIPTDLGQQHGMMRLQSPQSEVHPNDSASVMDDDVSAMEYRHSHKGTASLAGGALPVEDGTYVFKFRTPSGRTHRFQARHDDVEHLREIVSGKLATDPFFTDFQSTDDSDLRPDPIDFHLSYTDADGDSVLITSDHDVTEAVKIARLANSDRVVLFVQGGKGWAEAGASKSAVKAAEEIAAAAQEVKEVEKTEFIVPDITLPMHPHVPHVPHVHNHEHEEVLGIPKDLLLPASIGALAVAIIAVFTISRLTSSHY